MRERNLAEFERFRVMVVKPDPDMETLYTMFPVGSRWGKDIFLERWTEYTREELEGVLGAEWEESVGETLDKVLGLEVEGRRPGEEWEPLSSWRLDEERRERRVLVGARGRRSLGPAVGVVRVAQRRY